MWKSVSKFIAKNPGLITIITLALILKLAYLWAYHNLPVWDQLTVDNYYHHNWALDIAGGNLLGDTTYFRAPFYVYCLALLYSIFGASLSVGRLFGTVIGLLSIVMTYRITKRIFGHRVGQVAAIIQTLYPVPLYFDAELLLDPLFTLLLQWAVLRTLIWWDTKRPRDIFIVGLTVGLAIITRPTGAIVLPLIALVALSVLVGLRQVLLQLSLLALGTILVILPITARNILHAGDPVLIASQGGVNLYVGNNDAADGLSAKMPEPMGFNWRISQITHLAQIESGRELKPGEVSTFWFNKAKNWILRNPDSFLNLYVKKLYWSFSNREVSNNRDLGKFFEMIPILKYNPLSFGVIFALTVLGLVLHLNENRKSAFIFTLIMTYTIVSALFFFNSRFRLPLIPFYILLGSAALCWIADRLFLNRRQVIWPLGGVIIAGLFSFYPVIGYPPSDPSQYLISRGLYHAANDQYDRALEAFQQARRIDSLFPETNLNIGAIFVHLGQVDSAEYYFNEEKRLHTGRDKADINLASIYLLRGEKAKALERAGMAVTLRPYDPIANMVLLRALLEDTTMSHEDLLDSVSQAALRTKNDIYLLHDVAVRLSLRGYLDEASALLGRAMSATPPPIETDDYAFERNFRNSRPNWNKERARASYQLGYISGLTGNYIEAIDFSRRAIELDSSLAEAYVNLINGYSLTGQAMKARHTFDVALEKFPDNNYVRQLQEMFR